MWLLPAGGHTILLDDETQGRTCGLLVSTTACGRPSLAGLRFHTVLQPLGQPVRSLSTRGLRWDLSGAALAMGTPDGSRPWQPPSSSNEAVGVEGEGVLRECWTRKRARTVSGRLRAVGVPAAACSTKTSSAPELLFLSFFLGQRAGQG